MYEVLLFGLLIVVAYAIAHHAVMAIERQHGEPLGAWRMLIFFIVFLVLLLTAQWLMSALFSGGATAHD